MPLFLAAGGASAAEVGLIAGLYPARLGGSARSGPGTGRTASAASR